ncbi:MAG: 3-isopropylmalate dehydratase small subunit [Gammaproteobacteria bacterium]|nr:3-isopropylmalate dehydratase small subunit [Gammaproteobacteria bacterium]
MNKFVSHTGITTPLLHPNIDTDTIIPSREMTCVSKKGLKDGLFAAWRYTLPGSREANPDFILNRPAYENTSIILSGDNFGCGSSREHAVWALKEYGIRAIIAPSFGSIFYNNCIRNGILPVVLSNNAIKQMADWVGQDPQRHLLCIDLAKQTVRWSSEKVFEFEQDKAQNDMLIKGLDAISLTRMLDHKINAFEQNDRLERPWIYLD